MPQPAYYVKRQGFNLIEVVVTVTITAILAAIAVPRISHSVAVSQLRTAAGRVAADIGYIRMAAKNRGKRATVVFDIGSNIYGSLDVASPNGESTYTVDLTQTESPVSIDAVDFGGVTVVQFDMYGTPSSGGSITLSHGGASITLTVNSTTGFVTIP